MMLSRRISFNGVHFFDNKSSGGTMKLENQQSLENLRNEKFIHLFKTIFGM